MEGEKQKFLERKRDRKSKSRGTVLCSTSRSRTERDSFKERVSQETLSIDSLRESVS